MDKKQKLIGQILIEKGLINAAQLNEALDEQRRTKEFLGTILLKKKRISEKELMEALSARFDLEYMSLKDKYLDWDFVKQFSPSLVLDYKCLPISKDEWSVTVAITNPLDAWAIKKAEEETRGRKVKLVLVTETDMKEAIARFRQYLQANISKLL